MHVTAGSTSVGTKSITLFITIILLTGSLANVLPFYGFADGSGSGSSGSNHMRGTIIIVKDTVPDDPQDFSFTTNLKPSSFKLDDDGTKKPLSNTKIFKKIKTGTYHVTESSVQGFTLTSINCVEQGGISNSSGDTHQAKATINLEPGETVTCTFTNEKEVPPPQTGTIIIRKIAIGGDDTFGFTISGPTPSTQSIMTTNGFGTTGPITVTPGTYSVTEIIPSNWSLVSSTCQQIFMQAGQTVTCIFINIKEVPPIEEGTIIIIKDTIPDDPEDFSFTTNLNPSTFTLDDDSDGTLPNTQIYNNVAPGPYTVTEGSATNFTLLNIICVDPDNGTTKDLSQRTANIDLDAGEVVVCTFQNEKEEPTPEMGKITIVKDAIPDDPQDFQFSSNAFISAFVLDDDSDGTLSNQQDLPVAPGTYSVGEVNIPQGWALDSATCSDGSDVANMVVSAGEHVTCTFVNKKILPPEMGEIVIIKDAIPDDEQDFSFTGSGSIGNFDLDDDADGTLPNMLSFSVVAGIHSVTENTLPAGWDLTDIQCRDPSGGTTTSVGQKKAKIDVAPDEIVTCVFINTQRGNITIIKDTVPDNTQDFRFTANLNPSSFKLDDDSDPVLSNTKQYINIISGTYTVTELAVTGFALVDLVCKDPDQGSTTDLNNSKATIDLDPGETVECKFTNEKRVQLTVIKLLKQPNGIITKLKDTHVIVTNKDTGQQFEGDTDADGSVVFSLIPGTYTVQIIPPAAPDGCKYTPDIDTTDVTLVSLPKTIKVTNTIVCVQPGPAKIIVQKFWDKNMNGMLDAGDVTLQGVKIVLLNSLGNEVDRDVTDANGIVIFDPVATVNTQFIIDEPPQILPGNCKVLDRMVISDAGLLPIPHTITVSAGQTNPTTVKILNTLECVKLPLTVIKFKDDNRNQVQDDDEARLEGFEIKVFDSIGNLVDSEVTGPDGTATFNLIPGTYIVREGAFPPAPDDCAWFQTFPGPEKGLQHKITISTDDPTIEFGNFLKCPEPTGIGRIQVIKFQDDNMNRTQDNDEPRLAGFEIKVFDSTGTTVIASGFTDSNGHVQFDLPNGVYIVREVAPPVPDTCIGGKWVQTTPGLPSLQHKVIVLIGSDQTVIFGDVLVCTDIGKKVVVTKFNDKDGDGIRDTVPFLDAGVKGFLIRVYHPDDLTTPIKKAITDSQGKATFILTPGQYIITENVFGPVPLDCRGGTWTQTFPGSNSGFQHIVTVPIDPAITEVTMNDDGQPLLFGNKLSCYETPVKLVVHKFFDKNRDGVENNSESALKGFTIWVYDGQMQLKAKGTTDTTGSVTFTLPPGTYKVFEEFRILMPSECLGGTWIQTSPGPANEQTSPLVDIDELAMNSITITLFPGELKHISFGDVLDCPPQLDP